jgi:DNA-binding transcriptional LysR family regulator
MTLRQFEVFLAVARAHSFRRAADALHLSQPALSQHVRELEKEFGARLFDRGGRGIALTEAGRLVEEHGHRLFATLASAREAVGELTGLKRGRLLIGASTTPGIYIVPPAMATFRRRYPGIDLGLRIANSTAIETLVRANELDLGVVGGHRLAPGEECLAAGLLDELVLVVPPGHRWAERSAIPPAQLAEEPLLMREQGSATRELTERRLEHAGLRVRQGMELGHIEAIKQGVMAGLGVALLSVHAIRGEVAAGRLCTLRLRGLEFRRHFHVIHHEARTLSPSASAFVALVGAARGSSGLRTRLGKTPKLVDRT